MINVLHLRDTAVVCGPGKTIIETACAASDEFCHKVGLFMMHSQNGNAYQDAAVRRGVEVLPIRVAHPFDPRMLTTILGLVKRHRIDIIHSHEYKSDLLAFAISRIYRIPIMTTIHGWIQTDAKYRFYIRAGQIVLSWFDRVVAVSEQTRSAILACGVPEKKIAVIHNAIVTGNYRPEDFAPGFLRERFRLPADARIVGYVGRLSPEKGQCDLLSASALLRPRHPRLYIALVGDGPDRARLEQQARELGIADRVLFTGYLADVRPVYRDLDILALTSYTEGFPNAVLESLCMETPVVANDVGGVSEIVEDGVTGLLNPPGEPAAIASSLERYLADPARARQMALTGKRAVFERFSFPSRVAKEEALCRDILRERAR